ncbi:MAG: diguanylate cyclase [Syntrophotaleaceae bacterium]
MNEETSFSVRWYHSLLFRTPLVFVFLLTVLIGSLTLIMDRIGRPRLEEQSFRLVNQIGNTMVARLGERIAVAETLARAMATTAADLPLEVEDHMRLIPRLMDRLGPSSYIIGGGVWYEPYAFAPGLERRSFFWGRNPAGILEYVADYNDPGGAGYHREEWYVPGRFLSPNKIFWSRSYMDPHTYVPMVTCTVPIYRENRFFGVVTVDLKLEGMESFFEGEATKMGGYAFAVDRNGTFLSFPDVPLSQDRYQDKFGRQHVAYIQAAKLAEREPVFQPIAAALQESSAALLRRASPPDPSVAEDIARASDMISAVEAGRIAAVLQSPQTGQDRDILLQHFTTERDLLLKEPCSVAIFHVPSTHWKIVTVTPVSHAISAATALNRALLLALIVGVSAAVIAAFLALNRILMRPLARVTHQLKTAVDTNAEEMLCLDYNRPDEIGAFAYWFNRRTRKLADVLEQLRIARSDLEGRVAERTDKLEQANIKLELEVQQRRRAQHYLRRQALLDPLTNIPNRRSFDAALNAAWSTACKRGTSLALLLVDIDLFMQFNHTYGYQTGDQCLKDIAEMLAQGFRDHEGHLARFSGEQFAIILPDTDKAPAIDMAEQIRLQVEGLSIPHCGDGASGTVTVSIGVASMTPKDASAMEELVAAAVQALYRAKKEGRNRVRAIDESCE